MTSLVGFVRFEVGQLVRSWRFLLITVGFPVVFYVLFLRNRSAGRVIAGTVPWRTYLMVSMCSFGALVAALMAGGARLSAERASGWARQLRVTPLPGWAFLAAKMASGMALVLPVIVLVEVVGAAFGGVRLGAATWAELTALLWVTALPLVGLGVFVGFMVSADTAFPVVTALMFVLGYFGGLFDPVAEMPGALQAVARGLPSFHHAALGLALLDGAHLAPVHWLVLAGYAAALATGVVLKHRSEEARGLA